MRINTRNPKVSVIIVTFGRKDVLFNTITQVSELPYQNKEVIVVDQNSGEIAKDISAFCEKSGVMYAHIPVKGMPFARNKGIDIAEGQIIIFFDDDVEIHSRDFIQTCIGDLRDKKIGAVTSRVLQNSDQRLDAIKEVGIFNPYTGYAVSNWNFDKQTFVENMAGCAFAARRDDLIHAGKFNTLIAFNYYLEETEVAIRLKKMGYTILFDPRLEIKHLQAQGGARMNDEFSLKLAYCHNYAILLLCNYSFFYFIIFSSREVVKRVFSYILKGFKEYKRRMLVSAFRGVGRAVAV